MGARSIYNVSKSSIPSLKLSFKSFFLSQIFGLVDRKTFESIEQKNQELLIINQRNIEAIKSLSDKLGQSLSFQQEIVNNIASNLKVVENIPQSQQFLQQKIHDSFERATFYIQNTCQDILHAKTNLISSQNEIMDSMGALEIAEYMRSFMISNLLTKQIRIILQACINNNSEELENFIIKLQKNIQIVQMQMEQINFRLEKYNTKIEESIWKPFSMDHQLIESTEIINAPFFYEIMRLNKKLNVFEVNEKTKSIVIGETIPAILYFNKEKGCWLVKRRAKVVVLKPNLSK